MVLADLFTKGFGISKSNEDDGSKADKSKDAKGAGMGEKDVSDQKEDEDQLIGTDKKEENEKEQDTPDDVLGKNKGIEMSDEFDGKEYSVSEDSEEDEEGEDEQLDSVIGEAGSDAEKADEKPWDKDEDEEAGNMNEKNESGPSVIEKDTSSRELKAKDDGVDTADEPEESSSSDKPEEENNENVDQDNFGDSENLEDKIQKKEEALANAPGLTPDVGNEQIGDDMEIDTRPKRKMQISRKKLVQKIKSILKKVKMIKKRKSLLRKRWRIGLKMCVNHPKKKILELKGKNLCQKI